MSQKKVDKYKKEKNNREKLKKRERRILSLEKVVVTLVCIVIVGSIVYSAYDLMTRDDPDAEQEVVTTEMDVTAISDYMNSLSQTEAE